MKDERKTQVRNNYEYAKGIEFVDTINAIKVISEIIVPVVA